MKVYSYLESLNRIVDTAFVPTWEDAAKSSINGSRHAHTLRLPLNTSGLQYTFVQWTPSELSFTIPPDSLEWKWSEVFEDLHYVWFMVDIALISTDSDKLNDMLRYFRRLLDFKWFALKDIIVIFHNHALRHKRDDKYIRSIDNIVDRFSSLNEDKARNIYVLFADDDDSAKILVLLQKMMQAISLEREERLGQYQGR